MPKKKKILLILGAVVLLAAFFFPKNSSLCECSGIKRDWFLGEISKCFGIPYSCTQYEKGAIIVSFNEGTKYKDAKDLLSTLDVQVEEMPPLWQWQDFRPTDDTKLRTVDMFKLRVKDGKEDEVVSYLLQSPIVRAATKNYYLWKNF